MKEITKSEVVDYVKTFVEDPRNNTYFMSISREEPKEVLMQVEHSFYAQKKLD